MSMSEAEQRREARRQRILSNQASRLEKILGKKADPSENISSADESSSSKPSGRLPGGITNFNSNLRATEELADYIPTSIASQFSETAANTTTENGQHTLRTTNWTEGGGLKSLQVPPPRISVRQHHSVLALLSLASFFFGGPYLLMWLLIYEITFILYNGFTLPNFYTSKNSFFTLLALFGVSEIYRKRLGEIALVINWLTTDLTIFIASALVPVFLLHLVNTGAPISA